MKVKFVLRTPMLLKEDCTKKLAEYAKKKVEEIIAKYGVFEIKVVARPKGAEYPEEEEIYGRKRYWFEDELEKPVNV